MTIKEINDYAEENDVQILLFSSPDYENSIMGISSDNRVIYDYDKMVEDLMTNENLSEIDAIEFIEYNTIRSLAYYEKSPIILQIKNYYK